MKGLSSISSSFFFFFSCSHFWNISGLFHRSEGWIPVAYVDIYLCIHGFPVNTDSGPYNIHIGIAFLGIEEEGGGGRGRGGGGIILPDIANKRGKRTPSA